MKKTLFLLLALLFVGSGFAQRAPQAKLISSSEEQIVVNFQLNGYTLNRVQTPQGEQLIVRAPKMATNLEAGTPDLPMYVIPAVIGDLAEMTVNVINAEYTDYTNMEIAPSKGNFSRQINPDDVPYTYGDVYQQNAFWPAAQATLDAPYILRDFRGQNIVVHPFAYNPVTKTLRVYTNMTVAMTKVSDNGENQKVSRKGNDVKTSAEFKASYERRFINFGKTEAKYTFIEDDGEMLIICADQFMAGMQPLVDWKNQSGRPTTLVSVSEVGGNNDNTIKNYISNLYNDPSHNLAYVLFVGDYEHITPHSLGSERSDNWFGQVEGTDHYPEVFIGRFSVQTDAHVASQVNKVIFYERDVEESVTWGDKGMGIGYYGAGSGHYGEDDYQHIDRIRDTLLHYTYTQVTEHHGGSGGDASTTTISATTNQGISIINYCNHGSETSWGVANYSTSNVNSLTNDYMWPVVWSVACLNGKFNYGSECFAEAWMRATDNSTGVPTGAIGGMFSWMSQPWIPPMYGQDEMVDILTEWRSVDQFNHTLAGASLNGNMNVIDQSGSSGYDTHDTWILFGDPSLMVRTANPTNMNLSLNPAVLMIGMSSLEITAETNYGIATLSNAEGVIASAKIVDGTATLEFASLNSVETLTLTVIGYNKATEIMPLEVLPAEGAFISVDAFTPGNVPVNEEQLMSMTFKNVGVDPTQGTTNVVLSSEDTNITFSDNEASFDVLGANETVTLTDEFAFTVASGVEDGTKIQIDVTMTCGSNVWTGKAKITVGTPIIEFAGTQWVGSFVPGETVIIAANFHNKGHYQATNAVVTATSTSNYVTIAEETCTVGTISVDGTSPAIFSVTIDPSCPATEQLPIAFALTADNGITATGEVTLKNSCNLIFDLTDSYGDGWNGASLHVAFSDSTPAQNYTVNSGNSSATYTIEVGSGVEVTLTWNQGSWDSECGFTVRYEDGDDILVVAAGSVGSHLPFTFTVACAGEPIPGTVEPVTNLEYAIDEVNITLTLTWDAPEGAINYVIYRNGEEIGKTPETTFIDEDPKESSEYCVVAQFIAGNSEPVCFEIGEVLSVEENESAIRIYPNPVNNTLYINGGSTEFSYVLYNGMGQMVANGTANGTQRINVSSMAKGVYFLHINSGTQVLIQKVVVE